MSIDPHQVAKNIKTVFDKSAQISQSLRELSNTRVMAGVPSEKGLRDDEEDDESGLNNAALMYLHENGAPEANIPPRPVVYPAVRSIQKEVVALLKKIGGWAMEGKPEMVERGFHVIGILAQNSMRKRITEGPFIPLRPSTIAARKARGFKGEKPLIRSGQLRKALTYVIRKLGSTTSYGN